MTYRLILFIGFAALILTSGIAFGADFDVESATRAYLDEVQGAEREKSDRYFVGGYWLLLWGTIIAALIDWLFLRFRWSARIRDWAERVTKWRWLQPGLYVLPYSIIGALIALPWSLHTDYFREKSYGFVNQGFAEWFVELLVSMLIGTLVFMIFAMLIYAVIRKFPKNWWIIGTGVTTALIFVGMMLAPVFIAPIFNDYSELEEGPIKDDIIAMAEAYNVPTDKVYVFNQSKQHDRISANVSGFAGTMRISLNDNLLNNGTREEIKAVMGHEIGHYVRGHVWRNVLGLSLLFGLGFFIAGRLVPRMIEKHGDKWGVRDIADVASLPVIGIVLTLFSLFSTPISNSIIRIHEIDADKFGLEAAQEPDGFASIAMKLASYRKLEPGKLEEMIFFTHPSGENRVRRAMKWKAEKRPDAGD